MSPAAGLLFACALALMVAVLLVEALVEGLKRYPAPPHVMRPLSVQRPLPSQARQRGVMSSLASGSARLHMMTATVAGGASTMRKLAATLVPNASSDSDVDLVERALTVYQQRIVAAVVVLPIIWGDNATMVNRDDLLAILQGGAS